MIKKFARIENGAVAEIIEIELAADHAPDTHPLADRFHPSIVEQCVDVTGIEPLPACGDVYDGQAFAKPVIVVALGDVQTVARSLLLASDVIVTRCLEAGLKVPKAWKDFRESLRDVLRLPADASAPTLPIAPDKPAGI